MPADSISRNRLAVRVDPAVRKHTTAVHLRAGDRIAEDAPTYRGHGLAS